MISANPYLNFNGNTEDAFLFYKSIFGGEFLTTMRFGEMPGAENLPPEARDKIMHIALALNKDTMLLGTDAIEAMGQKLVFGNNQHICLMTESREEADRLFAGLAEGGNIKVPLEIAFWGDYYGAFTDKFGIGWMIVCSQNLLKNENEQ